MCAARSELSALLARARGRAILIVGDLMLDHFVMGGVERISPEAPVPVVRFDHEEFRLGGPANAAHTAAALGGRGARAGVVGADVHGDRLLEQLARIGVDASPVTVDPARCTTRKLRVVTTRNQQVARVDYESDGEVSPRKEEALVAKVRAAAANADVVLVSDYQKG